MSEVTAWISFRLSPEHTAMLDSVCKALLEDDAAEHGAFGNPDDKVVVFRKRLTTIKTVDRKK